MVLNIARMLACNSTLSELGLSKHRLVDSQLETLISYGLLRNASLTSLDLRANKLSGFSGATPSCRGERPFTLLFFFAGSPFVILLADDCNP